ncbi:potassium channel family protein [Candidatus Micrarchaeota archaeon]|nr:potassium channel family protein [Candidatus Micrarchaeota archaeon]MBU1930384.1 potassium channel family protein [Candidatus Micrarchaeota archaeon]
MLSIIHGLIQLARGVWQALRDPEIGGLIILVIGVLAIGTLFYNHVESWGIVNSLYFSVITLTTVGYGDFFPVTTLGKLFTIVYIFVGIGIILLFISKIAKTAWESHPIREWFHAHKNSGLSKKEDSTSEKPVKIPSEPQK